MSNRFGIYRGRRVLVTGHTGFKGSWLSLWLKELGADVSGISLASDERDGVFGTSRLEGLVDHRTLDIRDSDALSAQVQAINPEIVFHLAAQSLVRRSYEVPLETVETNTLGTAYLMHALAGCEATRAVVAVTTDKVYANSETGRAFREDAPLGGKDPYSASKSAAEMIVGGFTYLLTQKRPPAAVATARGGNVVGGGDWAEDRLIPDAVRAVRAGRPLVIRNPDAVRPWQHVLCLCHGYLDLAAALIERPAVAAGSWNFGPAEGDAVSVGAVLELMSRHMAFPEVQIDRDGALAKAESKLLRLDPTAATAQLGWKPAWNLDAAVRATAEWYQTWLDGGDLDAMTRHQIAQYMTAMARA